MPIHNVEQRRAKEHAEQNEPGHLSIISVCKAIEGMDGCINTTRGRWGDWGVGHTDEQLLPQAYAASFQLCSDRANCHSSPPDQHPFIMVRKKPLHQTVGISGCKLCSPHSGVEANSASI